VCSADAGTSCDAPSPLEVGAEAKAAAATDAGCCTAPEPQLIGFPTGLAHGRSGDN
jgi:hypothetical protein